MSKFKDILKAAQARDSEEVEAQDESQQSKRLSASSEVKSQKSPLSENDNPEAKSTPSAPKRGRPKGKRSDPNYEQVTAYIKKETYRQIKIALLQQEDVQDFSELVEKLLAEFLSTQKPENSDT